MSNDEYAVERQYTYVNALGNGDVLVSTEYGSLLSEAMLLENTREQLVRACRRIRHHQRLRIHMEILNLPGEQDVKETQESTVCEVCGGIKSLSFGIEAPPPLSASIIPQSVHAVHTFKMCFGHLGDAVKRENVDEPTQEA